MEFIHELNLQLDIPADKDTFITQCKKVYPADTVIDSILSNEIVPLDIRLVVYYYFSKTNSKRRATLSQEQLKKLQVLYPSLMEEKKLSESNRSKRKRQDNEQCKDNIKKRRTIGISINKDTILQGDLSIIRHIFSYLDLISVRYIRNTCRVYYAAYLSCPFFIVIPSETANIFRTGMHLASYALETSIDNELNKQYETVQYLIISARRATPRGGAQTKSNKKAIEVFDKLISRYPNRIRIYNLNRALGFDISKDTKIESLHLSSVSLHDVSYFHYMDYNPYRVLFDISRASIDHYLSRMKEIYPSVKEIVIHSERYQSASIFLDSVKTLFPSLKEIFLYNIKAPLNQEQSILSMIRTIKRMEDLHL